ncbi:MAG: hypothetical protein ACT4N8_11185 [Sphingosinicella sp.]|uniref:hypothetical protein n=1 Tax=Sphingosinicella sp. TaxID=1917971 RepID=UPI0040383D42
MRFSVALVLIHLAAGAASGAIAGVLGTLLFAAAAAGPAGLIFGFFLSGGGVVLGLKWLIIPTVLAGFTLWCVGDSRPQARRAWAWAATGAIAGLLCYVALPWPHVVATIAQGPELRDQPALIPLIFTLSGVGAAFAYWATMRIGLLFLPDEAAAAS